MLWNLRIWLCLLAIICGLQGCCCRQPVDRLIEQLDDSFSITRSQAAQSLGELRDKATKAIPALRKALRDTHWSVRADATEALGKIGKAAVVALPDLGRLFADPSDVVRNKAAIAMGKFNQAAVPILENLLGNADQQIRYTAVMALRTMGETARPLLLKSTRDISARVRRLIAETLLELQPPEIESLLNFLRDPSDDIRSYIAWKLGDLGNDKTAEKAAMRRNIAAALGQVLTDPSDHVRMYASFSLSRMRSEAFEALDALIAALQDREWYVRKNAASALAQIGSPASKAIPALANALRDETWDVKHEAMRALRLINASQAIPEMLKVFQDTNRHVRNYIAQTLGWMGNEANIAIPSLIAALSDPHEEVRESAIQALARIGLVAIPALLLGMRTQQPALRSRIIRALGQSKTTDPRARDELRKLLLDRDWRVRYRVAQALSQIAPINDKDLELLQQQLQHPTVKIRRMAALHIGLTSAHKQQASSALLKALADRDAKVRQNAVSALGWLAPISSIIHTSNQQLAIEISQQLYALYNRTTSSQEKRLAVISLTWWTPYLMPQNIERLQHALRSGDAQLGEYITHILSRLPNSREVMSLATDALNHTNDKVRSQAAQFFYKHGGKAIKEPAIFSQFQQDIIPALRKRLKDKSPLVRKYTAAALGNLGTHSAIAVDDLRQLLRDRDISVRKKTTAALGWIGKAALPALSELQQMLDDRDPHIKKNAVFALRRIGKDAIPKLLQAMKTHPDPLVKLNISMALRRNWLDPKQIPDIRNTLENVRDQPSSSKQLRDSIQATIRHLLSDDKPNVFWVDRPRSPTLDAFSPDILLPYYILR